jgi:predicted RNase H-like HicB family nuclease
MLKGKVMTCRYSMLIQWSDEDQVFVVSLPEFGGCKTHGLTYRSAVKHGVEALESLIDAYQAEGWALPNPTIFSSESLEEPEARAIG